MFRLLKFIYERVASVVTLLIFVFLVALVNDFAAPKTITCKPDATMMRPPEQLCDLVIW